MRVIAGSLRGRQLRAPAGTATRPTGDRVREAIFDILGSLVDIEGMAVADLYAGSGAMGIEALSRGAAHAVFVDNAREALTAVDENLTALGLAARATVVRADVLTWLATAHEVDLALCDPPYRFEQWPLLLERLRAPLAVLESDRPVVPPPTWEVVRNRRYGGTLVAVVRRLPDDAAPEKGTA